MTKAAEVAEKPSLNFNINHNSVLEFVWNFLPIACLILIAGPSFTLLYLIEDLQGLSYIIKVVGNQWFWSYELVSNFIYGNFEMLYLDGTLETEVDLLKQGSGFRLLMTSGCIYLVYLIKTTIYVTSNDVLHSWALPSLGLKVDGCPGRINKLVLWPGRIGLFYGQCSEICGINHSYMPSMVGVSKFF